MTEELKLDAKTEQALTTLSKSSSAKSALWTEAALRLDATLPFHKRTMAQWRKELTISWKGDELVPEEVSKMSISVGQKYQTVSQLIASTKACLTILEEEMEAKATEYANQKLKDIKEQMKGAKGRLPSRDKLKEDAKLEYINLADAIAQGKAELQFFKDLQDGLYFSLETLKTINTANAHNIKLSGVQ